MTRKRLLLGTGIAVVALAAIVVYVCFNPSTSGLFPRCLILSLTGYKCPGCGSQRFIHAMLNGDVRQALSYNIFLAGAIPVIVLYLLNDYTRLLPSWADKVLKHPVTIAALGLLTIAWWVLRNIYNW